MTDEPVAPPVAPPVAARHAPAADTPDDPRFDDVLHALEAVALRCRAKLWIRYLPLDESMRRADRAARVQRQGRLADVYRVTDATLRRWWPTRTTCLPRAVARYVMLRRRGVPVTLKIGITEDSPRRHQVVGHAWLELNGSPIMEPSPPSYVVTFSHPSPR